MSIVVPMVLAGLPPLSGQPPFDHGGFDRLLERARQLAGGNQFPR